PDRTEGEMAGRARGRRSDPPRPATRPARCRPPTRMRRGRGYPVRRRGSDCRRTAAAARSIEQAEQPVQLATGDGIARFDGDGLLKLADGLVHLVLSEVYAGEIEVRVVARLVAGRVLRALEPRDGLGLTTELDQIRAD